MGYWTLFLLLVTCFLLLVPGQKHLALSRLPAILFASPIGISFIFPGVAGFYVFYYWLFPRFLAHKKMIALSVIGILTCILVSLISTLVLTNLPNYRGTKNLFELATILFFLSLLVAIHGVIALVMRGFISWYADIKWKEALTARNFETELALVKSQLNPHFLFNSINNIDVLIMKDAAKASLFLNKLSNIMRFMLYETKPQKIPLDKELSYIDNYIELQKIRTKNEEYVHYVVEGDIEDIAIAPMLFIPFIENAFKHASNNKTGNVIDIHLQLTREKIVFTCRNLYSETAVAEQGGLGNELINKRLALLYPGRHTLTVTDNNNIYQTHLIIYLHDH